MPTDSRTSPSGTLGSLRGPPSAPLQGRLHAAEAGGEHPQPARLDHGIGGGGVGELDAEQRSEPGHGVPRPLMAGIGRQPGEAHPAYPRMLGQPFGQHLRAGLGLRQPERQGAQSAQREVGLHRPRDGPEGVAEMAEALVHRFVPGDHGAEQDVGVAGDHLGGRVHDDVGPGAQRLLQQGGGKGVVHHEGDAGRQLRTQPGEIGDLHHRVGRRFHPDQVGAVGRGQHRLGVGDVHPAERPAVAGRAFLDGGGQSLVAVPGEHHHRARLDQLQHGVARRHARGEGQRPAALERPDRLLQGQPGRVAVPAVVDAPSLVSALPT